MKRTVKVYNELLEKVLEYSLNAFKIGYTPIWNWVNGLNEFSKRLQPYFSKSIIIISYWWSMNHFQLALWKTPPPTHKNYLVWNQVWEKKSLKDNLITTITKVVGGGHMMDFKNHVSEVPLYKDFYSQLMIQNRTNEFSNYPRYWTLRKTLIHLKIHKLFSFHPPPKYGASLFQKYYTFKSTVIMNTYSFPQLEL